jgi:hypothetical protein
MRLTRRGKIARVLLIGSGIVLVVWLSGRIWWTDQGWCWGTMVECVGL